MKLLDYTIALPTPTTPFRIIPIGCFEADTELLTRNGWKGRPLLREGEEVLTLNIQRDCLEWQSIQTLIDHSAGVYSQLLYSTTHRFLVTPDHGIWYKYRDARRCTPPSTRWPKWKRRLAGSWPGVSPGVRVPVASQYEGKGLPYSVEMMQFLGWFIAEGSFSFDRRGKTPLVTASLSQSEGGGAEELRMVMARAEVPFSTTRSDRRGRVRTIVGVSTFSPRAVELRFSLPSAWARILWDIIPNKAIPWSWLDCTVEQFDALLDGLICGDGTWAARGRRGVLHQKDRGRLDVIQALCVMHGYKTTLRQSRAYPVLHSLSLRQVKEVSLSLPLQVVEWDGPVWCLTVPNQSVVTRRAGKPIILSNCVHAETDGFHEGLLKECLAEIAKPNTYMIGAGDYLDAVRTTARVVLEKYRAKGQDKWESQDAWATRAYEDFYSKYLHPIRDKIICLGQGNHFWSFSDGTTSDQYLCRLAGCAYGDKPTFIRLAVTCKGKHFKMFKILVHHGDWSSGYARMGTDVGATERKAEQFDAFDIFIFSHTHRRFSFNMTPSLDLPITGELRLVERPRVVIRTGCFTKSYDVKCLKHYAHRKLLPPTELGYVVLTTKFYAEYDKARYDRRVARHPEQRGLGGASGNMKYKFSVTY